MNTCLISRNIIDTRRANTPKLTINTAPCHSRKVATGSSWAPPAAGENGGKAEQLLAAAPAKAGNDIDVITNVIIATCVAGILSTMAANVQTNFYMNYVSCM